MSLSYFSRLSDRSDSMKFAIEKGHMNKTPCPSNSALRSHPENFRLLTGIQLNLPYTKRQPHLVPIATRRVLS
jgi:hypothetical protein